MDDVNVWIWVAMSLLLVTSVVFGVMAYEYSRRHAEDKLDWRFDQCEQNAYEHTRKLETKLREELVSLRSNVSSVWTEIETLVGKMETKNRR